MKTLIIILLCFMLGASSVSAERGILGAMSYDSPLGCAPNSVFNLVAGTILNTTSTASVGNILHSLTIFPNYNNGQGVAYQSMQGTSGNASITIATSGLHPTSYFGSLQYSTSGVPDISNSIGAVGIQSLQRLFIHGTRQTAPCNVTQCLHNWLFDTTGSGPGINTDFTIASANAGQSTLGGVQSTTDGTVFFLHRLSTPPNSTMLWQFDENVTTTLAFLNVGNVITREMAQDTNAVYFTRSSTNQVIKVEKIGMALTAFNITPTSLADNLVYSASQNSFYLATITGGPSLTIRQYNSTFSSEINNLVLGNEAIIPSGILSDEAASKLYIITEVPGFKRIRRVNPSTLTIEQTLSIPTGLVNFVAASDFTHKSLWISDANSSQAHIQRVQLCT